MPGSAAITLGHKGIWLALGRASLQNGRAIIGHWKIQAFGGVFLRRSPPLLVAGFGLPRSLEQMPHRALQAALAIRHVVEAARRRDSLPLGTFGPARTHLEHGLALSHRQQHHAQAVHGGMMDHGVSCLSHAAWGLWFMGYADQSLTSSQGALALAQEWAYPFSLVQALYWSAQLYQFLRDAALTQERAEAAIRLSTAQGFAQQQAQGTFLRGWALAVQRRGEEGLAQMRQGLAAWEATGAKLVRPYYLALLAEVCGNVGQIDEGLCILEEALAAAHITGDWWRAPS